MIHVTISCGTVPGVIGNLQAIEIIKIVTGLKRILLNLVCLIVIISYYL